MHESQSAFAVEYSDDLVRQAAYAFRDYLFKRYGPLLVGACIVNAFGLWLALRFGAEAGFALAGVGFVVVLGPTWLLYQYFLSPKRYAVKLRRVLPPRSRVSLSAASLSLEMPGQAAVIPWSMVKAVVETGSLYLIVVSPFAFTFVPRLGMSVEAGESLRARSQYRVAA